MTEPVMPYAIRKMDGKEVFVSEVPRGKAAGCVCICCGEAVQSKQGAVRRWHFSHLPPGGAQCDPDLVLHTSAILAIKKGIERAIEGNASYALHWVCPVCGEGTSEELARSDTIVCKEKSVVERTRSDLIVRLRDKTLIIEVVFTHEPSQQTLAAYQESGASVVIVRVKADEDVRRLETGIAPKEGHNYPSPPCRECEQKRVRAEERKRVYLRVRSEIKEADGKMKERAEAFLRPSTGSTPRFKYWKENRIGYVHLEPRRAIHAFQRELLKLGFRQDNADKPWLMRKNFTFCSPPHPYVYVDYGEERGWVDVPMPTVYAFGKDSLLGYHLDHLAHFVKSALADKGIPCHLHLGAYHRMDKDRPGPPCVDCDAWEAWRKHGSDGLEGILEHGHSDSEMRAAKRVTGYVHGMSP